MLLLALGAPALGATLTVGPTGRDHTTIGAAITAAQAGDTILVDPGTYAESLRVSKNLTVAGSGAPFTLTGTGPLFDCNGTPTVVLRDAVLEPTTGGGVDTDGGSLTLERVTVSGAALTVGNGAAVHASGGALAIVDSTFDDNAAFGNAQGGHLYASNTAVTISGGTFSAGTAEKGGAIWMIGGSLAATGTTFTGNRATFETETARGGAIRAQDAAVTLTDCTFDDNAANGGYGGHVSVFGGTLTVDGGTFEGGLADDHYGGAIAAYQAAVTVTGATFRGNRALVDANGDRGHGGAIIAYGATPGTLALDGCTFEGNAADGYGGAVRVESGALTVTASTFDGNTASYGGALHGMALANVTIDGSAFTANEATTAGGAVRWRPNDAGPTLVIAGSTFEDNVSGGPGGAVYASSGGAFTVEDSDFFGNGAVTGGAVSVNALGPTEVVRTRFCGNAATGTSGAHGGGFYAWQTGTLRFANATFADDAASLWGGGLYVQESGQTSVENSAFLSNTAANGGGVGFVSTNGSFRNNVVVGNASDGVTGSAAPAFTFAYDLWNANDDAPVSGTFDPDALGATNVLGEDPAFLAWTDDGDCTNDVLAPRAGSPLIDAGDPTVLDPDGSPSDIGPGGGPDADPAGWVDGDDDGVADAIDCAPADATIFPGAVEVPYDDVDQDCSGADLDDVDGDGVAGTEGGGTDCDDGDDGVSPDVAEVPYDGIDQNCSGADLTDVDGDGHDAEEAGGDDCDDDHDTIHPGATDVPGNFVDEDCSGADTPGGDPIVDDTGDDTEDGTKTCNCGTTDARAAGPWLLVTALIASRRARRARRA